jgi:Raf kinase inhibitor-like YbhB/YbcL family protein
MLLLIAAFGGCERATVHDPAPHSVTLTSEDFEDGGTIPQQFTCTGTNLSPELSWQNLPSGTHSLALVVSDPDSFLGAYVHWVVYNLPPEPDHLAQGAAKAGALPKGASEGLNSGKRIGYSGPCPPGRSAHRYLFTLYALDARVAHAPPVNREQLMKAMDGHVLGSGELMGRFSR